MRNVLSKILIFETTILYNYDVKDIICFITHNIQISQISSKIKVQNCNKFSIAKMLVAITLQ